MKAVHHDSPDGGEHETDQQTTTQSSDTVRSPKIVLRKRSQTLAQGPSAVPSRPAPPAAPLLTARTPLQLWLADLHRRADEAARTLAHRVPGALATIRAAASPMIVVPIQPVAAPPDPPPTSMTVSPTASSTPATSAVSAQVTVPPATALQVPSLAPPAAHPLVPRRPRSRWLYMIVHVAALAAVLLATTRSSMHLLQATLAVSPCLALARAFWLHGTWRRLPVAWRPLAGGRPLSPNGVVLRLLLPVYNIYWLFAAHMSLCTAINRAREAAGLPAGASRALAAVAVTTTLVPPVDLFVGLAIWEAYMWKCERGVTEIVTRGQPASLPP